MWGNDEHIKTLFSIIYCRLDMDTRLDFIILAAGNPDTRLDKAIMEIRYQCPVGILNGSFKVWGLFSCQIHVFNLVNTKY